MYPEQIEALAGVRAVLAVIAAILLFVGGHHLRELHEEVDSAIGLLAYGLGFASLALAIPVAYTRRERDERRTGG